MADIDDVLARCRIQRIELESWIERAWILPARGNGGGYVFSDTDIARVELICDLTRDLALDEDALGVVLPLLDQVYALRASLRRVADAIGGLPEPARNQLREQLRKTPPRRP